MQNLSLNPPSSGDPIGEARSLSPAAASSVDVPGDARAELPGGGGGGGGGGTTVGVDPARRGSAIIMEERLEGFV